MNWFNLLLTEKQDFVYNMTKSTSMFNIKTNMGGVYSNHFEEYTREIQRIECIYSWQYCGVLHIWGCILR